MRKFRTAVAVAALAAVALLVPSTASASSSHTSAIAKGGVSQNAWDWRG